MGWTYSYQMGERRNECRILVVTQLGKQSLERLTRRDNINVDFGKTDTRIVPSGKLLHVFNGWALQSELTINNITEDIYDLLGDAVSIADYMQLLQRRTTGLMNWK
jgi:hypothetical protein